MTNRSIAIDQLTDVRCASPMSPQTPLGSGDIKAQLKNITRVRVDVCGRAPICCHLSEGAPRFHQFSKRVIDFNKYHRTHIERLQKCTFM